jgi:hypothetical protein
VLRRRLDANRWAIESTWHPYPPWEVHHLNLPGRGRELLMGV